MDNGLLMDWIYISRFLLSISKCSYVSELLVFLLPRVNSVHLDHLQICGQEVGLRLGSWFVHVYIL